MRLALVSMILLPAAMPAMAQPAFSFSGNSSANFSVPLSPASGAVRASDYRADSEAPSFSDSRMRYTAYPSGLDRIDPGTIRVLGGEIGGNGVKGGAVVSLTWPTEP